MTREELVKAQEHYRAIGRHDMVVHTKGIITKMDEVARLIGILKVMEAKRAQP